MGKMFLGEKLFGNSKSWKGSQGQTHKNYLKKNCDGEFGILGKFPLRL